jgi:hypothetical protein
MPHVCTIQQLTMHNKAPRFDRIRTVCIYIYVCACCQLIPHSEALDFFFGIYHLKKQRAYVSSVTVHTHRECISITAMHVPDRRREQHLITALHAGRFLIWRNRKKYFTHDIFTSVALLAIVQVIFVVRNNFCFGHMFKSGPEFELKFLEQRSGNDGSKIASVVCLLFLSVFFLFKTRYGTVHAVI